MKIASPTRTMNLLQSEGDRSESLDTCSREDCTAKAGNIQSHCPFGLIGLSYRTASVDLRGRTSFTDDSARHLLNLLREHGVSEAMVLSTCNRTEIYFAGPDYDLVVRLLASAARTSVDEIKPHLYIKKSLCAACHLFRVVSGLDSAVLGETEIVAQVKHAWGVSDDFGSCGPGLSLLLQRSMEVSKRVRSETDLCRGITSTASLAVIQAQNKLGGLEGKKVALIGAGMIGERVCKDLAPLNLESLTILNRTEEKALRLVAKYGGQIGSMADLPKVMAEADVIISAISTQSPLIDDSMLAAESDRPRQQLLIDLGVPPNVQLDRSHRGVEVLNIDTLSETCSTNQERRLKSVPVALDILDEELKRIRTDLTMRTAAPTIRALVNHAEQIRRQNIDWAMERLTGLTDKERKIVEDLSSKIIKGMLQAPIEGLKHELAAAEHREIVTKLFKLEEKSDEQLAN